MLEIDLGEVLEKLPLNATEPVVKTEFVSPLLQVLGFNPSERYPEFSTDGGGDCVDFAARKNTYNDDFFCLPDVTHICY